MKKIQLKKNTKIIILVLVILFISLIPEKYIVSYENNNYKTRIRYRYPATFFANLFGIKPKTYILVDSLKGYPDKTIHIFSYLTNKAYQIILSKYGNSFNVLNINDIQ